MAVALFFVATPLAGAAPAPLAPGETLVVDRDEGIITALPARGAAREIATGLDRPSGAAVLADGSMLIAETGANRIMGVGGRFGDLRPVVEDVLAPTAMAVGGDGSVYVVLPLAGEVGRIDVDAGGYTAVAAGLALPAGVTERDGVLFVSQAGPDAHDVVRIDRDGNRSVLAGGFEEPGGLATGPGDTILVTDTGAGTVVALDGAGQRTELARVRRPTQIATDPFHPGPDEAYRFAVAAAEGIVRFDDTATRVSTVPGNDVIALASVPRGEAPLPPLVTTTVPPTTVAEVVPTTVPTSTPVTRITRTTLAPPPDVELDSGPTTSTYALAVSVGILVVVAVAVGAALVLRRPRDMVAAGFEERPLDADSVVDAFGPCAAREVELAEAEGNLRAIVVQRDAAKQRAVDLDEESSRATFEHLRARAELEDAVQQREARAASGRPEPPPDLRREDLALATDQGRAVLATFVRAEISAEELESRWLELGEHDAIEYTRLLGAARASGGRVSVAELRAAQREQHARAAAEVAEADLEHAQLEVERLAEREQQAMARIGEARQRLADCREGRPLRPPPPDGGVTAGDDPGAPIGREGDGPAAPAEPADDVAVATPAAASTPDPAVTIATPISDSATAATSMPDPAVTVATPISDSATAASPSGDGPPGPAPEGGPGGRGDEAVTSDPAGPTAAAPDRPTGADATPAEATIDVRDAELDLTPLALVQRAREAARRRAAGRSGEQPAIAADGPTRVSATSITDPAVDRIGDARPVGSGPGTADIERGDIEIVEDDVATVPGAPVVASGRTPSVAPAPGAGEGHDDGPIDLGGQPPAPGRR